jgi:hypothetical protein
MFLISINKNGSKLLHPDAAKLEPILAKLSEDELTLIVLAYDYYSPFRQLPEIERMRRAHDQVFKSSKKNIWDSPKIKEAIVAYMGLQYDERREQVKTYLTKISTINEAIRTENNPTTLANYIKTNKNLRDAVNAIEEELLMDEEKESINIQGKGKLSLLERYLRNKDKYIDVIKKRAVLKQEKINGEEVE